MKKNAVFLKKLETHAIKAAKEAGKILMRYFGKNKLMEVREKKNAGIVTKADILAEKKVIEVLSKASREFSFLGEESGITLKNKTGRWIIDPLDGTTNFAHGFPMFCVSIAAEWEGEVIVGVIYHPVLKDLYTAIKGKGAKLNGKKMKVSKTKKLEQAVFATGFAYQFPEILKKEIEVFGKVAACSRGLRRPGSAALDLAYTARGVFDGFWERGLQEWDVAAGALIVNEAGGKVTSYDGEAFKLDSGTIVASNSCLHRKLIKAMKPRR